MRCRPRSSGPRSAAVRAMAPAHPRGSLKMTATIRECIPDRCSDAGSWVMEVTVSEAYIVGAVRSPIGKRNGGLSSVHPVDLAAHVLQELIARTGVDPAAIEDVIMGCVSQVGPQAIDIARNAWLSAGLPETVPGVTI